MTESRSDRIVYALTKYGQRGASSRVRFRILSPILEARGWTIRHFPLLSDGLLARFYQTKSHSYSAIALSYLQFLRRVKTARKPALWWVEKELLPGLPVIAELLLLPVLDRAVIDYDDAVFLDFSDEKLGVLGRAEKFRRYARRAAHLTVGSEFVREQFHRWGAARVTKIPSTVQVENYPLHAHGAAEVVTIGWIGTPMTMPFLEPMRDVLSTLARRVRIRFCVVGARWECPGVEVVSVPWTEASEAAVVAGFDLGIMPLVDGKWERGKCGYKLIQYMAAGVVPVGSRVGENQAIIQEGQNGFLASTPDEWLAKLEALCRDPALRAEIGAAARAKALAHYDVSCAAKAVHDIFAGIMAMRTRRLA